MSERSTERTPDGHLLAAHDSLGVCEKGYAPKAPRPMTSAEPFAWLYTVARNSCQDPAGAPNLDAIIRGACGRSAYSLPGRLRAGPTAVTFSNRRDRRYRGTRLRLPDFAISCDDCS